MECPVCGFVASAFGAEAIQALADAIRRWNALASVRWLYTVPRPCRVPQPCKGHEKRSG